MTRNLRHVGKSGGLLGLPWMGAARSSLPAKKASVNYGGANPRHRRRGASAVEFAIVAPIFFLLIFGMIEYGRMVMVQQVLTNATREGARRAILADATTSNVTSVMRQYLTNASINGSNPNLQITVSPDPQSANPADESISVSLSVPFRDVSWLPSPMFLGSTNLNARSVMRRETFQ